MGNYSCEIYKDRIAEERGFKIILYTHPLCDIGVREGEMLKIRV